MKIYIPFGCIFNNIGFESNFFYNTKVFPTRHVVLFNFFYK